MAKIHDFTGGTTRRAMGTPQKGPIPVVTVLEAGKVGEHGYKAFSEIRFWSAEALLKVLRELHIPETHELKRIQYAEQVLGLKLIQMPPPVPSNEVVLLIGPGMRGQYAQLLAAVNVRTMSAVLSYLPDFMRVRDAREGLSLDAGIGPRLK